MSEDDEWFSIRVALTVMLAISIVASIASVISLNPFSFGFNLSFVYLPTEGLLLWTTYRKGQRSVTG